MKKIALVNQRYGLEVNGGSEYYTRLIAERLANHFEVDVITTWRKDNTFKTSFIDSEIGTRIYVVNVSAKAMRICNE